MTSDPGKNLASRVHRSLFHRFWNPYHAVLAAGVLSAGYFAVTATPWAVTGEFTRLGGHLLDIAGIDAADWDYFHRIGLDSTPLERTGGWVVFGMLAGSLLAALLGNDVKLRLPHHKRRLAQGLLGGVVAGFGARLALGCNLAAFFTGMPQFSFHAWLFMIALGIGTFAGTRVIRMRFWRGPPILATPGRGPEPATTRPGPSPARWATQPRVGAGVGIGILGVAALLAVGGQWLLAAAGVFGVAFGVLIQRGQICFTSALRDLWVSGRATMSKALAAAMMVATVLTFLVVQTGTPATVQVATPGTVLGGLLFGFGIVLAGGCETGMMYRAMEGQVHFVLVFVGNIVGATVLAYGWGHWGIEAALVRGWPEIDLRATWGPGAALLATLTLLAVWFAFAHWWQRRYRYDSGLDTEHRQTVPETAP